MSDQKLDWSKLPKQLSYLIQPAEKYGRLQFDDAIYNFLDNEMTDSDKDELQQLQEKIYRDSDVYQDWITQYSIVDHRESSLVYFMMHLMALGSEGGYL
jgi:hypothetical protein